MLRVPLNKIEPGMVLARPIPVPNDPYRFLLQRDREIPLDLVPRLKQLGILDVWVRHRDLEFLEDLIDRAWPIISATSTCTSARTSSRSCAAVPSNST
jgi:hypothetical protein